MSSSNYANFAEVVEESFVKEQCPEEYKRLVDYLKESETDLDSVSDCLDEYRGLDNIDFVTEEQEEEIRILYKNLLSEFNRKTELFLGIRYHNAEERGDEVDGIFWEVNGVYIYSLAGEKFKNKIERKFWTTWG